MEKAHIDGGAPFDWGKASADYAKYRDIYPAAYYQRLIDAGIGGKGQRILDLGTGTGVIPRHLAPYGATFVGADVSPEQIAEARRLTG